VPDECSLPKPQAYQVITEAEGQFLAAVKACGLEAVLSHYAACVLRDWLRWDGRPIDVTAPTAHRHPRIRVHRSKHIEREFFKRIPVTPPVRTIIDLSRTEDEATVKRALRQAKLSEAELAQLPTRLQAISPAPTASPLEDIVLDLILRAGFAHPDVNAPYALPDRVVYPDLRWPRQRLIVEVDSREWHSDPLARREDARRQADLEAAGERVLRITRMRSVTPSEPSPGCGPRERPTREALRRPAGCRAGRAAPAARSEPAAGARSPATAPTGPGPSRRRPRRTASARRVPPPRP
jgi:hypothetical protein